MARALGSARAALALALALAAAPPLASAADSFETAAPEDVGLDPAQLAALTEHLRSSPELGLHSVLLVKDGKLAYEQYFAGEDDDWGSPLGHVEFGPDTLHDLRSVTKTVTSLLVGIAIDRGFIPDVDARVLDLLPAYADRASPAARELRVRDLLTMSAGLDWNETTVPYTDPTNSEIEMTIADDPVEYVLTRRGVTPPGQRFTYNGGLTTLLAAILEARTGRPLLEWSREVFFEPLGIDRLEWHAHPAGLPMPASGLRLRPRDLARIGLAILHGGRFQGQPIVSEAWVNASTQTALAANRFAGYGYQWWIQRYSWDGRERDVPTASGNGGQRIFVLRDLDLVVVTTAGNYDAATLTTQILPESLLVEWILPAAGTGPIETEFGDWLRRVQIGIGVGVVAAIGAVGLTVRHFLRRRRTRPADPAGTAA